MIGLLSSIDCCHFSRSFVHWRVFVRFWISFKWMAHELCLRIMNSFFSCHICQKQTPILLKHYIFGNSVLAYFLFLMTRLLYLYPFARWVLYLEGAFDIEVGVLLPYKHLETYRSRPVEPLSQWITPAISIKLLCPHCFKLCFANIIFVLLRP